MAGPNEAIAQGSPPQQQPVAQQPPPQQQAAAEAPPGPSWARWLTIRFVGWPIGYAWALPNSILGLCFAPLAVLSGGGVRAERGAIEVYGGFAGFFLRKCCRGAGAMTLGHVILGQNRERLDHTRNHEHVHVSQYMRWGPFFLPLYGLSSFLCWRQGRDFYRENWFEIEAYGKYPC